MGVLILLPLLAIGWVARMTPRPSSLSEGRHAPLFSLQDQDGRTHQLADYRGRPVALVFYSRLDAESRQALQSLQEVLPEFDHSGIRLFAVASEPAAAQKEFHDREKLSFPLLSDPGAKVARQYGLDWRRNPDARAAFILGSHGIVLQKLQRLQPKRVGEQVATLANCCLSSARQARLRSLGKPLPDLSLPQVGAEKTERLLGTGNHAATVLFFLSARCPCSRGYNQRIQELAREYGEQNVRFLAIYSSADETPKEIADQAREAGFIFPVLRDEGNRVADALEARVTPETYLVDKKGILRYHGRLDDSRIEENVRSNDLRNALDALLANRMPPKPDIPAFGCAIARVQNQQPASP